MADVARSARLAHVARTESARKCLRVFASACVCARRPFLCVCTLVCLYARACVYAVRVRARRVATSP
jgi:hypothetical protein